MKKIYILIGVLLTTFLCSSEIVHATTYTLKDVVEKLEQSETYAYLNDKELGLSTKIEYTDKSIKITYDAGEKGGVITNFSYANDIISYSFPGNKTNPTEEDLGTALVDAMWISEICLIVGEFHGITAEAWKGIENIIGSYSLSENGIEMTTWNYKNEDESGSVSMSGYDTFKININNINFTAYGEPPLMPEPPVYEDEYNPSKETPNLDSKGDPIPNEKVENPNTGVAFPIFALSILGVISIICFSLNKKEKYFGKI